MLSSLPAARMNWLQGTRREPSDRLSDGLHWKALPAGFLGLAVPLPTLHNQPTCFSRVHAAIWGLFWDTDLGFLQHILEGPTGGRAECKGA